MVAVLLGGADGQEHHLPKIDRLVDLLPGEETDTKQVSALSLEAGRRSPQDLLVLPAVSYGLMAAADFVDK